MSEPTQDDPVIELIANALLHLPVRGSMLRLTAHQVRLALQKAGYRIVPPNPQEQGSERT